MSESLFQPLPAPGLDALPKASGAPNLSESLRRVFGFDTFRNDQEGIVRALLAGRDVFAVMPTGGGKSLCYQLPACLMDGVGVVISPLISLMKDQVDAARANGMRAAFWNSTLTSAERSGVARALQAGQLDLLYVSPERLGLGGFLDMLKSVRICLLAVDEAHCISEWGHDFRPDYLQLSQLAEHFPSVPLAAFTATATHRVQKDIIERLALRQPHMVRASFDRPNLFYQVEPKSSGEQQIADFLRSRKGQSAIVYRTTRKDVEATTDILVAAGLRAVPYHAGMEPVVRRANQEAFSRDEIDVVVATIAFGMGIDKSNVRYVIHGDLPKNIEGYYQETGRAGRDGAPAQCLLLYDMSDVRTLRFFITQMEKPEERQIASQKLSQMIDFAQDSGCRRKRLLKYFGEDYPGSNCGGCDFCRGPVNIHDRSVDAQKVMSAIARTDEKLGAKLIIDIVTGVESEALRAASAHTIKTFGVGKDKDAAHWQGIIDELLRQGQLQAGSSPEALAITARGKEILFGRRTFHLLQADEIEGKAAAAPSTPPEEAEVDPVLFEALRKRRKILAKEENVPPYVVASDRTLQDICRRLPRTLDAMAEVSGIGDVKLHRYGPAFVEEVKLHWADLPRSMRRAYAPSLEVPRRKKRKKGHNSTSF